MNEGTNGPPVALAHGRVGHVGVCSVSGAAARVVMLVGECLRGLVAGQKLG